MVVTPQVKGLLSHPDQLRETTEVQRRRDTIRLQELSQAELDPVEVGAAHFQRLLHSLLDDVGLYQLETMEGLPASDEEGKPLGRVSVGRAKLTPQKWPKYTIENPS